MNKIFEIYNSLNTSGKRLFRRKFKYNFGLSRDNTVYNKLKKNYNPSPIEVKVAIDLSEEIKKDNLVGIICVPCEDKNCPGELLPDGITSTHEYYKCDTCKRIFEINNDI
jgi:hypothetical protein